MALGPGEDWARKGSAMTDDRDLLSELREPTKALRRAIPETWAAFVGLHREVMTDGALPVHLEEAVALAISVAFRCEGCIAHHARATARAGATPEEVASVLEVALLMGGGSAAMYAPTAWSAFQEHRAPEPGEGVVR
jgi:AhpD family alkylhydroperoxidase